MNYIVGQRWLSETEPELGLGIVTQVEGKTLLISYPGSEEERRKISPRCSCGVTHAPGRPLGDSHLVEECSGHSNHNNKAFL